LINRVEDAVLKNDGFDDERVLKQMDKIKELL
jgi:hypothetical protein